MYSKESVDKILSYSFHIIHCIDNVDKFQLMNKARHNPNKFIMVIANDAAGYYSYKWAEMMSVYAFGAFEELCYSKDGFTSIEPNYDEINIQMMGRHFKNTILESGGSMHPSIVYKNFRGRPPAVDALLRHNGL